MDKRAHFIIGEGAFAIYSLFFWAITSIPLGTIFWGFIGAGIGSALPDIVEPAYHYTHRSVFHSRKVLNYSEIGFFITALFGFLMGVIYLFSNSNPFYYLFSYSYLISCFFLGYMVHLMADSTTKMGLPEV